METLTTPLLIRGRCVVAGRAEGEALVTTQTISGWGGINERDGSIIERRHELVGQSFAGKILVFPGAKGSSGWSAFFHMTRINGVAPAAMLFTRMTTKMALGAVVTRVPSMTDFDHDVFDSIRTGDWVSVDAEAGEIRVTRRGDSTS
ncbi:hypothetical protein PSM7751_02902 [Pseudooceanicola marinus]|uniref:Phosphomevalonate dehydratase small subunit-like domain-containing protein n=1 Tax=Pseudooceanicola marinus TaxID=396013 RepID=A0A1X6ZPN8_9RHOB|nr:DUF126 domain-containing protein [Pseudooceanicola marinus]PJE26766.1 DUF126 domain-containing protein [Pseudooceanicola marinus]SLN57670.1 hypothetical protein PSM7751_02902 [Pseudooceanicola marinus]